MSPDRTWVTVFFITLGGIILAGLVLFTPWQIWGSALAVTGVVVAILIARDNARKHRPIPEAEPVYEPPPPPRRDKQVTNIRLPSSRDDYYFLFSATVLWTPLGPDLDDSSVNLAALAEASIAERAAAITRHRQPEHVSLVRLELGRALAVPQPDASGHLHARAESINLVLPDADQERLDKLAAVRKSQDIWEHERKYEQSRRQYLKEDALKDTGSAVVWWLVRNDDEVDKAVADLEKLNRLSLVANNEDYEPLPHFEMPRWEPPTPNGNGDSPRASDDLSPIDHFDAFVQGADFLSHDNERILFVHQVAKVAKAYGGQAWAQDLLRRYTPDAPDDLEDPAPAP